MMGITENVLPVVLAVVPAVHFWKVNALPALWTRFLWVLKKHSHINYRCKGEFETWKQYISRDFDIGL
jgi:hypothetical protein